MKTLSRKHLLITGIPGTGKTEIGNYLEKYYDFKHIDIEAILNASQLEKDKGLKELFSMHERLIDQNIVFTWGFHPRDNEQHINYIKNLGATMFWFDGNREAARKSFLKRGTVSEELLNIQMGLINSVDIQKKYNPIFYDPFKKDGTFKKQATIAKEVLELI